MSAFSRNRFTQLIGAVVVIAGLSAFFFGARVELIVREGADERTVVTRARTVGDALQGAGVAVRPEDLVSPPVDASVESGMTVTIERATPVRIEIGAQTHTVYTRRTDIGAILLEAGLTVGPDDAVLVDGARFGASDVDAELPAVPRLIQVDRAVPIQIVDGADRLALYSAAATVGRALWDAGLRLRAADGVTPALDSPLAPGMEIRLARASEVLVYVDGQILPARSQHAQVGALLVDLGIALAGGDYAVPGLDQPVPEQGEVHVVRVLEQQLTEHVPIPFEAVSQPAPELELDQTGILQEGVSGILARRVRVRYENGAEVAREVDAEWLQSPPEPRIVGYGTKVVVRSLDTPGGPVEYWRAVDMYAVSYSPSRSGTPPDAPWYGRTRSGKQLAKGMVAVDLDVMPLGTLLYIPGYGFATAEDTGGGVQGRIIDLGYSDADYVSWHQNVTVYFLTPVPSADQIRWILP